MIDFQKLKQIPRLLLSVELQPVQGTRFQPTGFPDLGAALYQLPNSKIKMLLLESAQSVANRLEMTVWDEVTQNLTPLLNGISYVAVKRKGEEDQLTNSLLEAHRLNSVYILGGKNNKFLETLIKELAYSKDCAVDFHKLASVIAKYDLNGLIHGVFLEQVGGRCRIPRALSGFIEAANVEIVASGGVKNDRVKPSKDKDKNGESDPRQGNVPYARDEYAAEKIVAYFSLDIRQILGYRLGSDLEDLLIAISLYKIQTFLDNGLRLRTACDLECASTPVVRPNDFILPSLGELTDLLPALVKKCSSVFANPAITEIEYEAGKDKAASKNSPSKSKNVEETEEGGDK
jgi:CRISPR-associated protein Csb1